MRHPFIALINFYQRWLSPLLGPRCRFHPTCSSYARQALLEHGVIRGGWMTAMRILRCAPWSAGGIDPVPERFRWWPHTADGCSAEACHGNDSTPTDNIDGPGKRQ